MSYLGSEFASRGGGLVKQRSIERRDGFGEGKKGGTVERFSCGDKMN